jgi:hypothetical protein
MSSPSETSHHASMMRFSTASMVSRLLLKRFAMTSMSCTDEALPQGIQNTASAG